MSAASIKIIKLADLSDDREQMVSCRRTSKASVTVANRIQHVFVKFMAQAVEIRQALLLQSFHQQCVDINARLPGNPRIF